MGTAGSTARREDLSLGKIKLADWTEAEVVEMLKVFAQMDTDRSGQIEKGELESFIRLTGHSPHPASLTRRRRARAARYPDAPRGARSR